MAEAELNALKKLESNKSCANCDAFNKFGHGNVCEKFKTFVCSNCKSAHQSFSQRVKSVTMSNWTKEEVDALKEENGGGNAVAKRVWLGLWDESRLKKPQEGDHVDVYKRFIDKVYNDRAFYDDDAAANPSASSSSRRANGTSSRRATQATAQAAAPNLLDFSSPTASSSASFAPSFDAFASPPKNPGSPDAWGAFASAPAPASSSDGFGAFTSAPPAASNTASSFDPFGMSSVPTPAPASTPASFDPFGPSSSVPMTAAPTSNFDPFGASSMGHSQPTQASGFGFGGGMAPTPMAAPMQKNFSAFDALSGPPQAMGMGMGMNGGMPRGPGMMQGGMGMGMNPQPGMMNGGYGAPQQPRPMMGGNYMAPQGQNGVGSLRPLGNGGSRDPFAGLGLPGM